VILPTVAEVGGRLRVSAEVIDPNTQTTVYAESADGAGAESVLGSIDQVAKTLRGKLGESLASIDSTSKPLEKVATSNLDALRAYGLALNAHATGKHADALQLLIHAVELDPDFASANLRLASFYMGSDRPKARGYVESAGQRVDRLTARDRLHLDAYAASLRSPTAGLEQWRLMASLYPDFYAGQQNSGLQLWQYANRPAEAIPLLQEVATSQHPLRAVSFDLLGHVALAAGDTSLSGKSYAESAALSFPSLDYGPVALAMARRDREGATAELDLDREQPLPAFELYREFRQAMLLLDVGSVGAARDRLDRAVQRAEAAKLEFPARRFEAMAAILASATGEADDGWQARMDRIASAMPARGIERYEYAFVAAALATAAVNRRDPESAKRLLSLATDGVEIAEYPVLGNLVDVSRARLALLEGDVGAADALLDRWQRDGLFVTKATRLKSSLARKDLDAAEGLATNLEESRSSALGEWTEGYVLQPLSLVETAVAKLDVAELAMDSGDGSRARQALAEFRQRWPKLDSTSALGRRAAEADAALAQLLDEHPHP